MAILSEGTTETTRYGMKLLTNQGMSDSIRVSKDEGLFANPWET